MYPNNQNRELLRQLQTHRLCNFGASAYLQLNPEHSSGSIPSELNKLWCQLGSLSAAALSIPYSSDIRHMSDIEVAKRIKQEYELIARLEQIFAKLKERR